MKVKQLDWGYVSNGVYVSFTSFGDYTFSEASKEVRLMSYGGFDWRKEVDSFEDAMIVAQEDYEKRVLEHLEDCQPSPQELFESMAPIVRYGYNRACVELYEWINVDESTFTFDELMNKLNDMIDNKREMTSDDFLEYLKSEEE